MERVCPVSRSGSFVQLPGAFEMRSAKFLFVTPSSCGGPSIFGGVENWENAALVDTTDQ